MLVCSAAVAQAQELVGKVWEAETASFVSVSHMIDQLAEKKYILIGERHGRKAHQDREAVIITLAAKG